MLHKIFVIILILDHFVLLFLKFNLPKFHFKLDFISYFNIKIHLIGEETLDIHIKQTNGENFDIKLFEKRENLLLAENEK